MGKSVHNDVLDAMLSYVKNNATRLSVCSSEPTTYAEATSTYKLAMKTISSSDFTGPTDGDVSGRKITVNQAANMDVEASGTAQHVALCDSANSKLLYVTTCTPQVLTAGNTVTCPAWDIEVSDPT